MFVRDLRKEFFDALRHQKVLLLANLDVDSVAAVKILIYLFQCDQISYTLVPISGRTELIRSFKSHVVEGSGPRNVVLINCGATVDLAQDFGLIEEDDGSSKDLSNVVIYVADSHRPIDVCNIYNDGQIKLLMPQSDEEGIPDYNDIFQDSDSDDPDDDDKENDDDEGENKRPRFDEGKILKRRERRIWEERRGKILFDYTQFSYFGPSTALQMYELAWKMSRDTNDLLWYAIVGFTEQYLLKKSDEEHHLIATGSVRNHVSRLNNQAASEGLGIDCMKLTYEKELSLALYKHWSVYDSLIHTIYTACKFKIWSFKGKRTLSEFLAEMGLPMVVCKQLFPTIDLELRNEMCQLFESKAQKYGLDDITRGSFSANFGYRNQYSASDMVYAVLSHLEPANPVQGSSPFLKAMDCLSRSSIDILEEGIKLAKWELTIVFQQVQNFFDLNCVLSAGPFFYAFIRDGAPNSKFFGRPTWLAILAHYTIQAYASIKGKKALMLPLILSAPSCTEHNVSLVVGVPPVNDKSMKNLLGKAFEQSVKRTNARFRLDYFDTSIIQIRTEDRSRFYDGLISLLS